MIFADIVYHNFIRIAAGLAVQSLYKKDVSLRDVMECGIFFRTAYGHRNLLASMRRGGSNYLTLMMNLANDITVNGEGDYRYENELWMTDGEIQTSFDFRTPLNQTPVGRDADCPV